jgi:polysaccharide transporter, PST family
MFAGLPFGVVGVAGSYACCGLLIRMPLAFWLATRRGPVTMVDLYRAILPSICAALAVGSAGWLGRQLAGPDLTVSGVGLVGGAAVASGLIAFAVIPQSRRALLALSRMAVLIRPGSGRSVSETAIRSHDPTIAPSSSKVGAPFLRRSRPL